MTDGGGDHLKPTWSPDGRLVAYSSDQQGSADLYLMRADGTGVKRLTWTPHEETDPVWSPRPPPVKRGGEGSGDLFRVRIRCCDSRNHVL